MGNIPNPCGRGSRDPKLDIQRQPIAEEHLEKLAEREAANNNSFCSCCCRRNDGYEQLNVDERNHGYEQLNAVDRSRPACLLCCICWSFLLIMMLLVFPAVCGHMLLEKHDRWTEQVYADGKLLTPANFSRYVAWNGCERGFKSDSVLTGCASPCLTTEFIRAIDEYNKQHSFALVNFSSRQGRDGQTIATLQAWWLPSGKAKAPRVVLQHGINENFNSRMVVLASYLLRSIGIDVLVPSLRSHGLSEKGFDAATWGYEYPFDVLGAWDYAVKDPQGILGGPRPATQVGLMGFSTGAFLVSSAFGIDGNVPAIWADSGVWSVNGMAESFIAEYLGPLAVVLAPISVWFSKMWAGVDITKHSPSEELPRGPDTKRKVAVVSSTRDGFIPSKETMQLATFVESSPTKYELLVKMEMPAVCNGNAHCSIEFLHANQYRQTLFGFWHNVFNLSGTISSLPNLTRRLYSGLESSVWA